MESNSVSMEIRVRGIVQGVGFRPMVWRLAHECELSGDVSNDEAGILIHVSGSKNDISDFLTGLQREAPPLCHIEHIETQIRKTEYSGQSFRIVESRDGETRTQVTPDAATCPACREEVHNPKSGASAIRSPIAPIVVLAFPLSKMCPTTAQVRPCLILKCAQTAPLNMGIRLIGASIHSRLPAINVARKYGRNSWAGQRPNMISVQCLMMMWRRQLTLS